MGTNEGGGIMNDTLRTLANYRNLLVEHTELQKKHVHLYEEYEELFQENEILREDNARYTAANSQQLRKSKVGKSKNRRRFKKLGFNVIEGRQKPTQP